MPAYTEAASKGLTDYVAGFVVGTKAGNITKGEVHLGKHSVLDRLGLALAGAALHPAAADQQRVQIVVFEQRVRSMF